MTAAIGGAALCGLLLARPASATVLLFTHDGGSVESLETTHAAYGDRVTGTTATNGIYTYTYDISNGATPNIVVDYSSVRGAGELGNVIHTTAAGWADPVDYLHYKDGSIFYLTFTPDAGYGINFDSFNIDIYGGSVAPLNWTLRRDSIAGAVLDSGSIASLSAPNEALVAVNESYAGPVVLEITFSGTGNFGNVGVDDVTFTQFEVPEPASLALLAGGVTLTLLRRRRA